MSNRFRTNDEGDRLSYPGAAPTGPLTPPAARIPNCFGLSTCGISLRDKYLGKADSVHQNRLCSRLPLRRLDFLVQRWILEIRPEEFCRRR